VPKVQFDAISAGIASRANAFHDFDILTPSLWRKNDGATTLDIII
jgi:hypothetical protein